MGESAEPSKKALVVEDYADSAELLATILTECGYVSLRAADGPSALALAKDWPPDLVLLDLGLPGMDGYEVAHRLRNDLRLLDAKIVALSGYQPDEAKQKAAGIDSHLMKPVKLDQLRQLINC